MFVAETEDVRCEFSGAFDLFAELATSGWDWMERFVDARGIEPNVHEKMEKALGLKALVDFFLKVIGRQNCRYVRLKEGTTLERVVVEMGQYAGLPCYAFGLSLDRDRDV